MGDWIECNLPYYEYRSNKSFKAKGFSRTGTLIEVKYDNKLEQYLIGDINEHCGVCDDCTAFPYEAIIKRYKIVWEKEE